MILLIAKSSGARPIMTCLIPMVGTWRDASIRYNSGDEKLQLKRLNLIDILSIPPRDQLLRPISWKAKTGFTQKIHKEGKEHLVNQLNLGGGLAYKHESAGLFYGLIETDLNIGRAYRNNYVIIAGRNLA